MTITAFGWCFLPVLLALVAWRREHLLTLLPVAAVLQAPAVAVVPLGAESYGITPFNAVALFVGLHLVALVATRRSVSAGARSSRAALFGWLGFHAVAAAGAITLPFLFEGVTLFSMIHREGVHQPPVAHAFTLANLAQAINAIVLAVLFLYAAQYRDASLVLRRLCVGIAIAFLVALLAAAYQRFAMLGLWPLALEFWGSNSGYNQYFYDPGFGPSFGRVGLPFIEPSYASVFFASVAAGACTAFVFSAGRRSLMLATGLLASVAVANTVGSSGLLALASFMALLIVAACVPWPGVNHLVARRLGIAMFALGGLFAAFAIYQVDRGTSPALAPLRDAVGWTLLKFTDQVTEYRTAAMHRGWQVFLDTYGLGAGAGSTRASSYVISLMANMGLPGFLLFAYALLHQFVPLLRRALGAGERDALLLAGGTTCLLLGLAIGISDQNWPVAWVALLAGYAWLAARAQHEAVAPAASDQHQAPRR